MVASPPIDFGAQDTYFVVAHFHYTIMGGSVFGIFAAIYFWWPKVFGLRLREGLGRASFALMFIGFNVTFFSMFLLGAQGMPRRIVDYLPSDGWTGLNIAATIGAAVLAIGILTTVANMWVSRRAERAGPDPWEGNSLEWVTSSPPPEHNFKALPPIRSERPAWDLRESNR
jgi:cytochrome c oxidase subunit 1